MEEQQRQYVEAAWGPLLQLLRQDAAQRVPPNLAGDKAARAAIKDKWGAVNKALADAAQQQVGCGLAGGGKWQGQCAAGGSASQGAATGAARRGTASWAGRLATTGMACSRRAASSTAAPQG